MNSTFFPISKSFLSEKAIAQTVEAAYGLSNVRCQLLTATMRDVYVVSSAEDQYILLIYRHKLRTAVEISDEWRFVAYLTANHIPVPPAIPNDRGELLLSFPAPEGIRYGVLIKYVAGKHFRHRPGVKAAADYGRLIARIHTLSDESPDQYMRPENDVAHLLDQFVNAFESQFPERDQAAGYLRQAAGLICSRVAKLPKSRPYYGMIHGDVIRANALVGDDGKVTVIDFDLCGPGWRVYDIASFLITLKGTKEQGIYGQAFLDGYNGIRPLAKVEQDAIPLFEAARAIFSIGIPAMNVYHWGKAAVLTWLDGYLEQVEHSMKQLV
jgi:Ser/Thr protein kinase RdoA (MazF antagonist)